MTSAHKGKADDTDRMVGVRLRNLRLARGMSQKKLAAEIGVKSQQIQKYERGTNRIGAGRLYQIARALNVSVLAFFLGNTEAAPLPELSPREWQLVEHFRALPGHFHRFALSMLRNLCSACQAQKGGAE
jgi:transcriptional regulator with XRE-family HTH domain